MKWKRLQQKKRTERTAEWRYKAAKDRGSRKSRRRKLENSIRFGTRAESLSQSFSAGFVGNAESSSDKSMPAVRVKVMRGSM